MATSLDDRIADLLKGAQGAFGALVHALRTAPPPVERLAALLAHEHPLVRRAALAGCAGRTDAALAEAARAHAKDPLPGVRGPADAIGAARRSTTCSRRCSPMTRGARISRRAGGAGARASCRPWWRRSTTTTTGSSGRLPPGPRDAPALRALAVCFARRDDIATCRGRGSRRERVLERAGAGGRARAGADGPKAVERLESLGWRRYPRRVGPRRTAAGST
jgi:hypothetical protein